MKAIDDNDDINRGILTIDEDALDRELFRQPRIMGKRCKELAAAKLEYEQSKSKADTLYASLALKVRKFPQKYDIAKVTEDLVKQVVTCHPRYVEAVEETHQCKYRVDLLQSVVTALEHKKRALEGLISLHAMDYFSTPDADDETVVNMRKQRSRKMKK